MRVREVFFHDFRSFRGLRRISFVDPLTDAARPLTVLAGTNGSGKTSVFDTIEALLSFVANMRPRSDVAQEAQHGSLIGARLQISRDDLASSGLFLRDVTPAVVTVVLGHEAKIPKDVDFDAPGTISLVVDDRDEGIGHGRHFVAERRDDLAQDNMLQGGLIYLPSDRQLGPSTRGPVEPPPRKREWLFRYFTPDGWPGSLEQLWVWQNYLDLEEGKGERSHLKTFVETVEDILGPDRRITVREGRVRVPVGWTNGAGERPQVGLDQLPSGERHVLLLFGELARRRRPGAIILIDEPELSLHPTMQRLVVHRLREFAREWDSQVILATHSLDILRAAHESERVILDQLDNPPTPPEEEDAYVPNA